MWSTSKRTLHDVIEDALGLPQILRVVGDGGSDHERFFSDRCRANGIDETVPVAFGHAERHCAAALQVDEQHCHDAERSAVVHSRSDADFCVVSALGDSPLPFVREDVAYHHSLVDTDAFGFLHERPHVGWRGAGCGTAVHGGAEDDEQADDGQSESDVFLSACSH